jgi:hypothetical protein
MLDTQAQYNGFKNRIINGAMVIDQRNAGASVSGTSGVYTLDRWDVQNNSGSARFNVQQNGGAVTPPAGFANYLGVTSTGAYSVAAGDVISIRQKIEGYNSADLAWGTASAATVTLSFWVRSSLTGTFGGSLKNPSAAYTYPFSYTISAANTWEYETITITGALASTWASTNSASIEIYFSMGTGATYTGTAGAWAAADYRNATGAVSVVATNAATWYVTGVQLEKGSTATSFDYRPYGTELALCQRYFEIIKKQDSGSETLIGIGYVYTNPNTFMNYPFKVTKRAEPTMTLVGTATSFQVLNTAGNWLQGTNVTASPNQQSTRLNVTSSFSGMTAGQAIEVRCDNGGGQMWISAEL